MQCLNGKFTNGLTPIATAEEAWLKDTAIETIQIEVQNENSNKRPDPQWSEEYSKWSNVCVIRVSEKGRGEEPENIYLK